MKFQFEKKELENFKDAIHTEWVLTNGIGGYAGSSILGAHNRIHQGYLIASLHPPVERYLILSKTNEKILCDELVYDFTTAQHAGSVVGKGTVNLADLPEAYRTDNTVHVASDFVIREPIYTEGNRFLTSFVYDGIVTFTYDAGDVRMIKQIALVQGKNQVAVSYEIENRGRAATLSIVPLMNFREHSTASTSQTLSFFTEACGPAGFVLRPRIRPEVKIWLNVSTGKRIEREQLYDIDMQLQTEVDNETPGLDSHFTPYEIMVDLPAQQTITLSLLCGVEVNSRMLPADRGQMSADAAHRICQVNRKHTEELLALAPLSKNAFVKDHLDEIRPLYEALVVAAHQFLSVRASTGYQTILAGLPWFTDWGRDTMIAFSGLTLVTHHYEEAKEILLTFAKYIHHGIVPNMFPDDGQDPLYNTVDASLWYFYAVDQYLHYVGTPEAYDFVEQEIYPALEEIMDAYEKGTDFSIYMEEDGLIHAGSGTDQVTWMDVRVGDWVVTPRHGKPVEINALWYNALCVMQKLSARFRGDEEAKRYAIRAQQVKESFQQFWNAKEGCLFDVLEGEYKDASIRPNQIYAVSLPYTMLTPEQEKFIVGVVETQLYAERGIRSLSPFHKDYHPVYVGSLPKRDAAYHQGTAWGFLMGGFVTAYVKVHGKTIAAREQALQYLAPVQKHLRDGCVGSISEIFDAEPPHTARGCYAQAWSVGEVLRCLVEDICQG